MTERERILAVLRREKPDRLPWCADLAYWINGLRGMGSYPKEYEDTCGDNGLQKLHRDIGAGFYLQGYFPFQPLYRCGVTLTEKREGDRLLRTFRTPVGELNEVTEFSHVSFSWGYRKRLVEDIDDLRVFAYIAEHTDYVPDYELARSRYETVGDNGVVLCYMPKSPMMELVALQSGVENFTYMAADEEEELDAILRALEEKCDEACRLTLDSPAECIMIPENISSESVGKRFYHRYMEGYHRKWTERIRQAGKYSFVHQDGTTRGLITELSESGFDVIEAVTPKPVGDVEIEEVRSLVRPETIIWGGIPGGYFSDIVPQEIFEAHVLRCIETMKNAPNFVLGVADEVVPGSRWERIYRVRELVDRYGEM